MLLNDRQIRELAKSHNLIQPFEEKNLNPFGYDLTLATSFLFPRRSSLFEQEFNTYEGVYCVIPSNSFVLGQSCEKIEMPSDLTGICIGRSSYNRQGIITAVAVLEAGWRGTVTITITNSSGSSMKVFAGKGIMQALFLIGEIPGRTYDIKVEARYQNQEGVTAAKAL